MISEEKKDDLELRLITTLAPMLFAVAVFALGASAAIPGPPNPRFDGMLSILAAFCIFSTALIVDSALDKVTLDFEKRLHFLGNGYLAFCVVNGIMTLIVPSLYVTKEVGFYGLDRHFIAFCLAGISVFFKMMIREDNGFWAAAMLVTFLWSAGQAAALVFHLPYLSLANGIMHG